MIGVHGLYIYGGLLKRIIDPASTAPLGDVDVIALDAKVMAVMTERFGIVFRRVNTAITRTPYFIGKAGQGNAKIVHLALLHSHEQAMRYVMNNQFDIDRLALSDHHLICDPSLDLNAICNAIRCRRATRVQSTRDMTLYAKTRPQIEQHYEARLRSKGYLVID
ncbi:hypothetical protein [Pseudoduganella umbonata]|uniref:Poly A polymerase head domain-containing protein n=1 Tax=Pseudoduganella umbonata TaxID=864828 RepID=A0A4P8HY90_9BURK|nr:hypothetical protein [Pseudoduganella umbonata]MBB3223470.1 hypothetical protein [Pseudoduganella umbonata]QCP13640.1 hypothetical protein FCL38_26790 [Pseudoduganella umbonata]